MSDMSQPPLPDEPNMDMPQQDTPPPQKRVGKKKPASATPPSSDKDAGDSKKPLKGLGAVMVRNEFYKDGYRSLRMVAVVQSAIILILIGLFFFVINTRQTEYVYFATTEDGRLVPMLPLSEPNLSTPALMSWVAQSATETMTFGFHDYRKRLQESSRFFTRTGWASFTRALESSRIIETVESNQQVVSATPRSAPVIVSEGLVNGRYQWEVEMPMNITYRAGSQTRSDNLLIRFLIVRVPKLQSPNGVGIEQWIATYG